jgi:hypothetical protein
MITLQDMRSRLEHGVSNVIGDAERAASDSPERFPTIGGADVPPCVITPIAGLEQARDGALTLDQAAGMDGNSCPAGQSPRNRSGSGTVGLSPALSPWDQLSESQAEPASPIGAELVVDRSIRRCSARGTARRC